MGTQEHLEPRPEIEVSGTGGIKIQAPLFRNGNQSSAVEDGDFIRIRAIHVAPLITLA